MGDYYLREKQFKHCYSTPWWFGAVLHNFDCLPNNSCTKYASYQVSGQECIAPSGQQGALRQL